jgi:drug/metabolite transporter (DMT)-like permease
VAGLSRWLAESRVAVILAATMHVVIMSLTHVLGRSILVKEHVPPTITVTLRCLVASAVLLASYAAWRPRPSGGRLGAREWGLVVLIMALAVPLNQFFYILGLKFAPVVHSSLLFCTTPLVISVLDAVFCGHRAPKTTWAGAALALGGVVLVLEERGLHFGSDALKGDLILSVSVLAWSILTLVSRPLLPRVTRFSLVRLALLGGTALLLPITAVDMARFDFASLSEKAIAFILFLGVFTSVVSYLNWYFLLSRIGAVRSGMLLTLQPVPTAIMGWLFLDEPLTGQLVAGGAVVLAGLLLVQVSEARFDASRLAREAPAG